MRLGFTQKLVLITALVSALVWLVFGGAFFQVAKSSLEDQLANYQVAKARDLLDEVDRALFSAYQGIQVVAQEYPVVNFLYDETGSTRDLEGVSEDLERISLLTGPWRIISLLTEDGNPVVSNMPETRGREIRDHPEHDAAVKAAMDNEVYVSDLHFVGPQAIPSMIFTAPIHREGLQESAVEGVVLGKYAWLAVMQLLDSVDDDVTAQLLRADGTVIAASAEYHHRLGARAPEWSAIQAAGLGSGSVVLDQRDAQDDAPSMMVAARQKGHLGYQGNDWVLVLEVPFESMLAPVYRLSNQLVLIGLVGVIALCAVLYLSIHYLTRPLSAMTRRVSAFAQGDLSARVDIASRAEDEITRLARAFNGMAEDIGFYIDQVKENSEEVRAFAYIVSHDLRAPLVNLKGFAAEMGYSVDELKSLLAPALVSLPPEARKQVESILDEDIPEALGFIDSSVNRMDGQIQAILKLSRLGRKELVWEEIDCTALVNQLLSSLQHQLESKAITVNVGKLPVVTGDAFALEQIFGNLLDNAIKYMTGPQGEIDIWSQEGPQHWTFHIRDTGPGIDPANIPRAFEIFRRVGSTDIPGEGMGLAYVKALVRRHGGRIWCESVVGEGSTFSFTLSRSPDSLGSKGTDFS